MPANKLKAVSPVVPGYEQFEVLLAKNQPEYGPLPVLISRDPFAVVLSRWEVTPEQLGALEVGCPIFLQQMSFGAPPMPVMLTVGEPDNLLQNEFDPSLNTFDEAVGQMAVQWLRNMAIAGATLVEDPNLPIERQKQLVTDMFLKGVLDAFANRAKNVDAPRIII